MAGVNDFIIEDFRGNAGAWRDWADVNQQSTGVEKMTSGGGVGKHSCIGRRGGPVGTILQVESDDCLVKAGTLGGELALPIGVRFGKMLLKCRPGLSNGCLHAEEA